MKNDKLLEMYTTMLKIRLFEERVIDENGTDDTGVIGDDVRVDGARSGEAHLD